MKYFIDANIFLRVLVKENEKTFQECLKFLQLVETKKIKAVSSVLVLAEINWVLESFYNFNKTKTIEAIESVSKLRGLSIVDKVNLPLTLQFYKKNKIKFIDALLASQPTIQSGQVIIVSYDRDFDKIGIKRLEPSALID